MAVLGKQLNNSHPHLTHRLLLYRRELTNTIHLIAVYEHMGVRGKLYKGRSEDLPIQMWQQMTQYWRRSVSDQSLYDTKFLLKLLTDDWM
jgi:hypothetical protein